MLVNAAAGDRRSSEDSNAQLPQEQGIALFNLQKQRLQEIGAEDAKKRAQSILMQEGVVTDPTLSPTKKAIFAETLREVSMLAFRYCHLSTVCSGGARETVG